LVGEGSRAGLDRRDGVRETWLSLLRRAARNEQAMLIDKVKVGCSLAMLQCLDRPHRIAFVLGDIMEM
jgi:hypothetical protein